MTRPDLTWPDPTCPDPIWLAWPYPNRPDLTWRTLVIHLGETQFLESFDSSVTWQVPNSATFNVSVVSCYQLTDCSHCWIKKKFNNYFWVLIFNDFLFTYNIFPVKHIQSITCVYCREMKLLRFYAVQVYCESIGIDWPKIRDRIRLTG